MKIDHTFAHLMVAILLSCNSLAFVHDVSCPRRLSVDAIASPLEQIKRDFVGSLENAYDFNEVNPVSSLFLSRLVEQISPETISRNIVESFGELGAGKWRVIYVQECSTSFGFGSFFRDVTSADVELGNDGRIACKFNCINPTPYELLLNGNFGTARNNVMIKVDNVQSKKSHADDAIDGSKVTMSDLKGVPTTIAASILEKNWQQIFAGVVIIDIAYIDESLAVFDLDFLARVKGKRICARKEPDFF